MQNICRQHHPLMENSMYVVSKSLRQGPPPFQTPVSLRVQETPVGILGLKPAQVLRASSSTLAVHRRDIGHRGSASLGTTAISCGLLLGFRLHRRWKSLPSGWQLYLLLLICTLFQLSQELTTIGKRFEVAHLP